MWVGSAVTTIEFSIQTPGGGAPTNITVPATGGTVQGFSNLVTDGTYMTIAVAASNYGALAAIDIATQTLEPLTGHSGSSLGAVLFGGNVYAFGGVASFHSESLEWAIPAGGLLNLNEYTPGVLGCPCEDGTDFWSALLGTTTIYQVPIATFGANTFTPYTLAAAALSIGFRFTAPQTGYDGRFMYLAADTGGVIIFDTTDQSSVVVNTGTDFVNCYYSANLDMVILDDTSQNIYTMAPGAAGGVPVNIGNANTITADMVGVGSAGFGDGPSGTLWGSANNTAATEAYMYSLSKSSNPMRLLL
jgi:hypothetical protein